MVSTEQIIDRYCIPISMSAFVLTIPEAMDKGILESSSLLLPGNIEGIEFEALLPLGITVEYIEKREFTELIAVRELLQNALDETEQLFGKPLATINQDSNGMWIEDNGRGILIDAFRIGGGSKEPWMRGFFGEGLKIAASYLIHKGYPVLFFSSDKVYELIELPKNSTNAGIFLLIGKNNRTIQGTKILISGFKQEIKETQKIVRFWNEELKGRKIAEETFSSEQSTKEMPSAIFDYPNELYIRNMYVGPMSEVAKRESLLSYDLWWFRMDVSRKLMTQSIPLMFIEIAKVLERSESCRKIFVEKLVESKMLKITDLHGKHFIEFNPVFATVEGHLFVYACPKGMIDMFVTVLGLEKEKERIVRVHSEKEAEKAIEQGWVPINFHYELTKEMNIIPEFSEKSKK